MPDINDIENPFGAASGQRKRKPVAKAKPVRKKPIKRTQKNVKKRAWWPYWLGAFALAILLSPFYYGYILKFASSSWFWLRHPHEDPSYRTYESYNIRIPRKHKIHGIDVSYYQGKIDWPLVSSMEEDSVKISFAFIKATEGLLKVDPYFRRNWREAPKAGITVGAYHYFRPKKDGLWQANFFLQTVHFEAGDLPPVVDVEELEGLSADQLRRQLNKFVVRVEEKTGVKPIIYSGLKFYKDYLQGYYKDYVFWVAHYYKAKLKLPSNEWSFWQHADNARINGINHKVDFNSFNGDSTAFQKLLVR